MKQTGTFGKQTGWKAGLTALVLALGVVIMPESICAKIKDVPVPDDITPVTWEVSEDHLMIDTDEARELYERIKAGDYPTVEELQDDPVVQELDRLSAYYSEVYGDTSGIQTEEREKLRGEILEKFLARGSARTDHKKDDGTPVYVYDGPLDYDYQAEENKQRFAEDKAGYLRENLDRAQWSHRLDTEMFEAFVQFYDRHIG